MHFQDEIIHLKVKVKVLIISEFTHEKEIIKNNNFNFYYLFPTQLY